MLGLRQLCMFSFPRAEQSDAFHVAYKCEPWFHQFFVSSTVLAVAEWYSSLPESDSWTYRSAFCMFRWPSIFITRSVSFVLSAGWLNNCLRFAVGYISQIASSEGLMVPTEWERVLPTWIMNYLIRPRAWQGYSVSTLLIQFDLTLLRWQFYSFGMVRA